MPSDLPEGNGGHDREERARHALKRTLVKTWVGGDLESQIDAERTQPSQVQRRFPVIIEVSAAFPGGVAAARRLLVENYYIDHTGQDSALLPAATPIPLPEPIRQHWNSPRFAPLDTIDVRKSLFTEAYLFGKLLVDTIHKLVEDCGRELAHPIHKIWYDHELHPFIYQSARTIKCDASRIAFSTDGEGIIWAVADTGIDRRHPHFALNANLTGLPPTVRHRDFTTSFVDDDTSEQQALTDQAGHGTHVAGIIAGRTRVGFPEGPDEVASIVVHRDVRTAEAEVTSIPDAAPSEISGLAPRCKLLSLKVLPAASPGVASDLVAAIGYVQQINGYGRAIKVHGLNLSLGYAFDPIWFAAGQSPLCVEVDRLVRCGVVVVVAAGNAGYGRVTTQQGRTEPAALGSTIADPGNARLAITVGSTHRDQPHLYGVSYFSAKGPTADGRMKPDLVAPGERIVSCEAPVPPSAPANAVIAAFKEDSGTSMAAPHVSGAIAGFLSVRSEYKGRPEEVKEIFLAAATTLRRQPEFQGAGLLDIMRALQSV